ncbi:MAG: hypothetical protein H6622_17500 [Halobacteriovoraceae bacterium]|nr:hypothetical protein [Halobacteriovoraceae bacterium]
MKLYLFYFFLIFYSGLVFSQDKQGRVVKLVNHKKCQNLFARPDKSEIIELDSYQRKKTEQKAISVFDKNGFNQSIVRFIDKHTDGNELLTQLGIFTKKMSSIDYKNAKYLLASLPRHQVWWNKEKSLSLILQIKDKFKILNERKYFGLSESEIKNNRVKLYYEIIVLDQVIQKLDENLSVEEFLEMALLIKSITYNKNNASITENKVQALNYYFLNRLSQKVYFPGTLLKRRLLQSLISQEQLSQNIFADFFEEKQSITFQDFKIILLEIMGQETIEVLNSEISLKKFQTFKFFDDKDLNFNQILMSLHKAYELLTIKENENLDFFESYTLVASIINFQDISPDEKIKLLEYFFLLHAQKIGLNLFKSQETTSLYLQWVNSYISIPRFRISLMHHFFSHVDEISDIDLMFALINLRDQNHYWGDRGPDGDNIIIESINNNLGSHFELLTDPYWLSPLERTALFEWLQKPFILTGKMNVELASNRIEEILNNVNNYVKDQSGLSQNLNKQMIEYFKKLLRVSISKARRVNR